MKRFLLIPSFLATITSVAQPNFALGLNGSSNYVTIGTPLPSNTSYTKEAWVYQTVTAGAQNILSSLNSPFWINGGTLSAGQAGSFSQVADPSVFPLNRWVHVAVTYDAPSTTMKLYRDGILISTASVISSYTSENTFIGSHQGTTSFFQGKIDEVRIWSIALTQVQLKQKMFKGPANNATGLVAYYTCNDGLGTTLTSSCTNTSGLNGTLQGGTTWVASPVQFLTNALSFDGTTSVVPIPDDVTLDITTAITLEAWCYATKNSGIQNVICKSSNTMNTGYIFPRTDDGWAHVVLYLNIGGWKTLSATYPSLNAWHHLAATYDGSMMKLYIDGVLASSRAQTGTISTNTNPLALGNQTGYSEFFGGSADEFRIWNVARTQTQIQNSMNFELDPTTQIGLVSYYTCDQGIPSGDNAGLNTLVDQKGTNNGTLTNFALSGASSNFVAQNAGLFALPLKWLSFTVQNQDRHVLLMWSTATEFNTKEFTIQHSSNGTDWKDIGVVGATVNSNVRRDYTFTHINPIYGINYYRIRQTDIDGRSSYSETRSLKFNLNNQVFVVLKNPIDNGLMQIRLSGPATLSLYNCEGKLLWQQLTTEGTKIFNVNRYAKGIYILRSSNQSEKILVQ